MVTGKLDIRILYHIHIHLFSETRGHIWDIHPLRNNFGHFISGLRMVEQSLEEKWGPETEKASISDTYTQGIQTSD